MFDYQACCKMGTYFVPVSSPTNNMLSMIIHYFTSAWKTLTRRKGYNFLNITGLSTGLAVCMIIFLILQHEFSYDRYHKNADRLYQLVSKYWTPAGEQYQISTPFEAIRALRHDYPLVKFTEVYVTHSTQVTVANQKY